MGISLRGEFLGGEGRGNEFQTEWKISQGTGRKEIPKGRPHRMGSSSRRPDRKRRSQGITARRKERYRKGIWTHKCSQASLSPPSPEIMFFSRIPFANLL